MRVLSLAVLALLGVQAIEPTRPGLGASITGQGITNAKNIIAPLIFTKLQNLQIPEIDISGGKFTNLQISLPQPSLNNINVGFDGANNGIELNVQQASGEIKSDFTYTYLITVNGAADIKIKNIGVDFDIGLETQPGTPSTELAPKLKVVKSIVTIDPADVDVTLSGSLVAKIAGLLVPLIKSSLIPTIVSTVEQTINDTINQTVNPDLQKYGNEITIPYLAGVTADYAQYGSGATFTADNIFEMSVLGYFYNKNSDVPSKYTPVAFPVRDPNGQAAQGYLSEYTLNTLLESGYSTQNTLDITYLLSKLNVTVTTDNLGVVVPEILTKYGAGKAVGLSGKFITKEGKITMTPTDNQLDVNLAVTVTVDNEEAIYAEFNNIQAIGQVSSSNGAIFGALSTSHIGDAVDSTFRSSISGMTAASLQKELQAVTDTNVATLNALLKAGIVIPTLFGI
jgi:hypothetical protein